MTTSSELGRILGVDPYILDDLDEKMSERVGRSDVLESFINNNRLMVQKTLDVLDPRHTSADEVREILRKRILEHEEQLVKYIDKFDGRDEFKFLLQKKTTSSRRNFFNKHNRFFEFVPAVKFVYIFYKLLLVFEYSLPKNFSYFVRWGMSRVKNIKGFLNHQPVVIYR